MPKVVAAGAAAGRDENAGGRAAETFTQLFGDLLVFVCHCFDRIVIYGYLSGLSRLDSHSKRRL
jgi:hypothetical protein